MRRFIAGVAAAGIAVAAAMVTSGLHSASADTLLPSVVSPTPVSWTPNVSADTTVGQEGSGAACNATFFGSGNLTCQSEVYSTAYVNGEVVVSGAFTEACQPGKYSQGLCTPGTQVTRDDIFAYQAGTGIIDPNFDPVLNKGPAWTVIAGPSGSNTVYVGGAFSTVNGATHKGLVQLNVNPGVTSGPTADGSVVTGFKASVSNYVRDLVLSPDGTALYVGGQFTSADGVSTFADSDKVVGLARLNASTGALDQSFTFTLGDPISGLPVKVEAMALSPNGDELAVSGTALQVNGQSRPRLAVINTGGTLGATSALADFYAPILNNNCSAEHDYVRGLDFSPDGTFIVTGDTGYQNDGSMPYSTCDAVARYNINASDTTTTGTPVDVAPAWIDYGGGDSFYSIAIAGNVVYAGGHDRWVNDYCGNNNACEPNVLLVDGISALDANTGMGLPWWHPQTLRGDGTMYLSTFPAGTYDGSSSGLVLGTDVDVIGGAYHAENAIFPVASATSSSAGGPIPSGMFNEEGGSNTGTPMCLDDPADSSATGTEAQISTCLNDAEQNWTVPSPGSAGTVQVNGLCLDTTGGGPGTLVELNTCSSGLSSQQWQQGAGNTLVNPASGLCLDDPSDSTSNGTQLDVATCVADDTGQVWPLPEAQAPPAPPAKGPVWMTSEEQSDTQVPCLDDAGDSTATGNKVQAETCKGDPEQNWTVEASGQIRINTSYCLDTSGGGTASGTSVVLDPCSKSSLTQQWTPGPDNELVNQGASAANSTPYCLEAPAVSNGTQMEIAACDGGNNQAWQLPTV
jgi:Ricin-type beta-trefoil lectin domain